MPEPPLAGRPLSELFEQVAAREPAPGGGSSAAWACALAAALTEMTAAFALGGGRDEALQERMQVVLRRAGELRAQALALAERELTSYAPVLGALRSGPAGPERERRVGEALSTAADVPLEIARCAAEVSELAVEALDGGNEHLRGDAVTGVLLAEAACRSAGRLAELNLAGAPDDPRLSEMQALAGRAGAARGRVI